MLSDQVEMMGGRGGSGGAALAPGSPAAIERDVRAAYFKLAGEPGDLVPLARLRPMLGKSLPKADVDKVLKQMDRDPNVNLLPDPNRKALPKAAHDAAVVIGGEPNHLIAIRRPARK